MRRPLAGTIESVGEDHSFACLRADDGRRFTYSVTRPGDLSFDASHVGRRVVFSGYERRGGHVASTLRLGPPPSAPADVWPPWGQYVRVICRISWLYPLSGYCTLNAEKLPYDIPYVYGRRKRKDLRCGDMVIAELLRAQKSVKAYKVVRLPKDYLSKMAEHEHLLTPIP